MNVVLSVFLSFSLFYFLVYFYSAPVANKRHVIYDACSISAALAKKARLALAPDRRRLL